MQEENLKIIKIGLEQILSHPTWDILLIFFFIAAGFFYGISAGKRRIVSALLFTYVAIAVFPLLPVEKIASITEIKNIFYVKSVLFTTLFFSLYFLLGNKKIKFGFSKGESWWQLFLLSFFQVGLLLNTIFTLLPPEKIKILAPVTREIFAKPQTKIWWYILPLLALFIIKKIEQREE